MIRLGASHHCHIDRVENQGVNGDDGPMKTHEAWSNMLSEISASTGIDDLTLDESGVCGLEYEGDLSLAIECPPDSPEVYMYAILAPLPEHDAKSCYERLLTANFLGLQTAGASLAISERHRALTLCSSEAVDRLDATALQMQLGNFITTARRWKDDLAAESKHEASSLNAVEMEEVHWEHIASTAMRV